MGSSLYLRPKCNLIEDTAYLVDRYCMNLHSDGLAEITF